MPAPLHPTRTYDRAVGPSQVITLRLPPQTFTQSLSATLSFVGNFAKGLLYLQTFSATLFQSSGGAPNDGDPVGLWPDSSGNGNDATQTGSARPTFKTNIINGKPVVRFTSAGLSGLNLATGLSSSTPFTVFVVMKQYNATDSLWSLACSAQSAPWCPFISGSSVYIDDGNSYASITNIWTGAFHIFTARLGTAMGGYFFVDGTSYTGSIGSAIGSGTFNNIGYRGNTPDYSDGDITELIYYHADLTDTNRANIEKGLGTKYGITVAGGSAVDPSSVSGLTGWWKADGIIGASVALGSLRLKTFKLLSATFSPVAALLKKISDAGFAAALAFVGILAKNSTRRLTATLSFVGNLATSKTFVRALTATLNFSGAIKRATGKALSATLSFVVTQTKRIVHSAFTATQSFAAAVTRTLNRNLTATLSWIGNLATSFIAGGGHVFTQSLTATLSFVGAFRNRANKNFAPILSVTAVLTRRVARSLTATLSFISNLAKSIRKAGFAATLSFTGFLAASKSFLKSLTATLSFTGTLTRRIGKAFSATLSFIGNLATNLIHGAQTFFKSFTATLSPTATVTKKYVDAGFTATLTFIGSVSTVVAHFFVRTFTATLSFVGTLTRTRGYARLLTATLNMSGAIKRQTRKALAGTLIFSTALRKAIRKGLAAILSFVVFFFRGGFTIFFAGQKAGSTVHIQVAGSSLHLEQRGSTVQIQVAGSSVNIHRAGSELTVERTE